jgi:hypothetical protein
VRRAHLVYLLGVALALGCAPHPATVPPTPPIASVTAPAAPPPPPPRVLRIFRPQGDERTPVFSVQADAARVYFNDGAGRIWAAPKDGAHPAAALVDDPHDSVRSFVLAGDTIYYAAREAIREVPTTGGPSTAWKDGRAERAGPILLVSDGQHVYHTVFDGSATFRSSIATHRAERFFGGGKHQTLAVDDTNLYIASYFGGTITAVSKRTRRPRVLVSGVRRPVRLVLDEDHVYFTSEADGTVRRVGKRGGRVEVLARGQRGQEHMAVDATHIYWATRTASGTHALMRARIVPEPGVAPEQLYDGLSSAAGLAIDASFVYVADRGRGEVVRVSKTSPPNASVTTVDPIAVAPAASRAP